MCFLFLLCQIHFENVTRHIFLCALKNLKLIRKLKIFLSIVSNSYLLLHECRQLYEIVIIQRDLNKNFVCFWCTFNIFTTLYSYCRRFAFLSPFEECILSSVVGSSLFDFIFPAHSLLMSPYAFILDFLLSSIFSSFACMQIKYNSTHIFDVWSFQFPVEYVSESM